VSDNKKDNIDNALERLLTPDGVGRKRKAQILLEFCETQNHNITRERINKLLKDKAFV